MNPKELRIGNYIKIQHFEPDGYHDMYETPNVKIRGFNDGSDMEGSKVICFYETPSKIGGCIVSGLHDIHAEPIVITEEILTHLGWEWYKPLNHYRFVINDLWFKLYKRDGDFLFTFVNLNGDENQEMPRVVVKSVHKLQNLIYDLSEQELILN